MSKGGAAGGCPLRRRVCGCCSCCGCIGNTCAGAPGAAQRVALDPSDSTAGCTKDGATATSCGPGMASANCKRCAGI
eukprot:3182796-Amphidinium_carterae.1